MSIREGRYAQGTPSWVDLAVDDVDRAIAFYAGLFGWECVKGEPETGYYTRALVDGHAAAGIGGKMPGMESIPSVWTTYLAVDDADATAKAVADAGGSMVAEPFDVMQYGRMAIGLDPNQAAFGIWQAYEMLGADIVNQPGAFTWNENMSHGYEAAKAFYSAVFGHGIEDMGGGLNYAGLTVDGRPVAGVGELSDAEGQPAWMAYFSTADTDATAARAVELGGGQIGDAADTPFGRMARLRGPEGEVFSVIEADDLSDS